MANSELGAGGFRFRKAAQLFSWNFVSLYVLAVLCLMDTEGVYMEYVKL